MRLQIRDPVRELGGLEKFVVLLQVVRADPKKIGDQTAKAAECDRGERQHWRRVLQTAQQASGRAASRSRFSEFCTRPEVNSSSARQRQQEDFFDARVHERRLKVEGCNGMKIEKRRTRGLHSACHLPSATCSSIFHWVPCAVASSRRLNRMIPTIAKMPPSSRTICANARPSSPHGDVAPGAQRINRREIFHQRDDRQDALERGISTASAPECPATPVSSLPAATEPDSDRIRQRAAGQHHHQHRQRKKGRDRKGQKTRRHQPQRRHQRHPAENNPQPAREIRREAALADTKPRCRPRAETAALCRSGWRTRWSARRFCRTDSAELKFVKRVRCQAHRLALPDFLGIRIADLPYHRETCRRDSGSPH